MLDIAYPVLNNFSQHLINVFYRPSTMLRTLPNLYNLIFTKPNKICSQA